MPVRTGYRRTAAQLAELVAVVDELLDVSAELDPLLLDESRLAPSPPELSAAARDVLDDLPRLSVL
jgi:hypothetical protein